MTHTNNRLLDDLARLMTDAAGMARSARGEVDTFFRSQAERILSELDIVSREEFEAVKMMAQAAREENARLAERIAALEGAKPKATRTKAAKPKA